MCGAICRRNLLGRQGAVDPVAETVSLSRKRSRTQTALIDKRVCGLGVKTREGEGEEREGKREEAKNQAA